jgi:FtsP/CotA-like multicopper oxidase with cupredoxin domain
MEPTPASTRTDTLSVAAVIFSILALVGTIVGIGIAAAGDDGGGGGGTKAVAAAATSANVELTEFSITPKVVEVAAGGSLHVSNTGAIQHNLTVEGTKIATANLNGGDSATLALTDLKEGTYSLLCTVAGHAAAGMTAELHVGASGAQGQAGQAAAHSTSNMTPEEMDAAATARVKAFPAATQGKGNQLLEPTIVEGGVKQYDLEASVFQWEVEPGKTVEVWGYNKQVPGPRIEVKTGDRVRIRLTNHLKESTTLHLHGLDIPNEMDGTPDLTQPQIKVGETFVYEFTAKGPAVGMYHAHSDSQVQVPMGLAGAILIDDMPAPAGRSYDQRVQMVLTDAGNIGFGINGKAFPATEPIVAKVGETILVDYFNEGFQIHPMHLHGPQQTVIAKDGVPLTVPYSGDTIMIAPGERYSVLVTATRPGTWAFHCHILTHAEAPSGFFGMTTAMVVK